MSLGWASSSSRGLWGGSALLPPLEIKTDRRPLPLASGGDVEGQVPMASSCAGCFSWATCAAPPPSERGGEPTLRAQARARGTREGQRQRTGSRPQRRCWSTWRERWSGSGRYLHRHARAVSKLASTEASGSRDTAEGRDSVDGLGLGLGLGLRLATRRFGGGLGLGLGLGLGCELGLGLATRTLTLTLTLTPNPGRVG